MAIAVYNLGMIDHRVGSMDHRLNDNLFHVLRLFRSGSNVSLQVDELPAAEKQPTGSSSSLDVGSTTTTSIRWHRKTVSFLQSI